MTLKIEKANITKATAGALCTFYDIVSTNIIEAGVLNLGVEDVFPEFSELLDELHKIVTYYKSVPTLESANAVDKEVIHICGSIFTRIYSGIYSCRNEVKTSSRMLMTIIRPYRRFSDKSRVERPTMVLALLQQLLLPEMECHVKALDLDEEVKLLFQKEKQLCDELQNYIANMAKYKTCTNKQTVLEVRKRIAPFYTAMINVVNAKLLLASTPELRLFAAKINAAIAMLRQSELAQGKIRSHSATTDRTG